MYPSQCPPLSDPQSAPSLSLKVISVSNSVMSYALAADFKQYALAYVLNDLPTSEKEEKKSENADTSISTSNFEEIIQGKAEPKPVEPS